MLRSDEILALDEITEACQLMVDHCEQFTESTDDAELAALFDELAGLHRQQVAKLDEQVERLGELPKRPDPDREALEQLATWLRGEFVESRRRAMLDKLFETEEGLQLKIGQALDLELPEQARKLLIELRGRVGAALARIAAARKS